MHSDVVHTADEQLATSLELMPNAALAHTLSGELLAANPEGAALLARTRHGWRDSDGATPWEQAAVGASHTSELRLESTDGSSRWVSAFSRPTTAHDGQGIVVTTLIDTTERRGWAAEVLDDFRSRFAMSWALSELAVVLIGVDGDERGTVLAANDATRSMLDRSSVEGMELADAFAGLAPEVPLGQVVDELCAGDSDHCNVVLTGADNGSILLGMTVARALTGRPLFILGHVLDQSRLVQAEQSHRRELARSAAIHAHSSDVVVVLSGTGTFDYVGPSALRVLGHDSVEITGSSVFDLIHPSDRELAREALASTAGRPGVAPPLRMRVRHGDHRWVPVEVIATNLLGAEDIDGVVVTIRDLSGAADAVSETMRREQRYRGIVEHASDGIIVVDAHGTIEYANGRMGEIMACSPAELIGRNALEMAGPAAQSEAVLHVDRARRGQDERYPFELLRLDGSPVRVMVSSSPLLEDGVMTGAVSWLTDVTEIERTRVELRARERHLSALLDAMPDLFFRLSRDGRCLECRCSDPALLWMPAEWFVGQSVDDILTDAIAPGVASMVRAAVTTALDSGALQALRYEVQVDGATRYYEARLTAVADDEALVIIRDMTDLQHSEEVRLDQARELVGQQAALERASLERELERTRRTDAMGYLAATMAHDVNNLLGVVSNYASTIRRTTEDPAVAGDAEQISAAVQRGAELTDRLLRVGRQQRSEHVRVSMRELIEQLADNLRGVFAGGCTFSVEGVGGDDPLDLLGAPPRLGQAVTNLVLNARDAAEQHDTGGSVRIELRRGEHPPDDAILRSSHQGDHVVVTVHDDGAGIDADDRRRIFDPFVSTKQARGGTGLGLSIVRDVVREHGGAIVVDSGSSGTSISLWIPRRRAHSPGDASGTAPTGVGPTVLLVDDDEHMRASTERLVRQLGINVVAADSGAHALRILDAGTAVDALLTDVRMPTMSGTELAIRVKRARPFMPIAFLTGYAQDIPSAPGLDEIVRLAKPFDQAQLGQVLAQMLGSQVPVG